MEIEMDLNQFYSEMIEKLIRECGYMYKEEVIRSAIYNLFVKYFGKAEADDFEWMYLGIKVERD